MNRGSFCLAGSLRREPVAADAVCDVRQRGGHIEAAFAAGGSGGGVPRAAWPTRDSLSHPAAMRTTSSAVPTCRMLATSALAGATVMTCGLAVHLVAVPRAVELRVPATGRPPLRLDTVPPDAGGARHPPDRRRLVPVDRACPQRGARFRTMLHRVVAWFAVSCQLSARAHQRAGSQGA